MGGLPEARACSAAPKARRHPRIAQCAAVFGDADPSQPEPGVQPRAHLTHSTRDHRCPLTPDMRRDVDTIRNYLFGGGYPDPVSNAEQLAFLFFFYLVEGIDAENQARPRC
jgi:hypothetical protein